MHCNNCNIDETVEHRHDPVTDWGEPAVWLECAGCGAVVPGSARTPEQDLDDAVAQDNN